jgi:hypothetical protein
VVVGPGAGTYGGTYGPPYYRGYWHNTWGQTWGWSPYGYSYGYYPYPSGMAYGYGYASTPVAAGEAEPFVAAAPEPRGPTFGVGLRGSALRAGEDHPAAEGIGVVVRFPARPVEVELELGQDRYGSGSDRRDTRLGANLIVPIAGDVLVPYLLVGAGMNFANFALTGDDLHQGYLTGGGGLALKLGSSFAISVDARYLVREFFDNDDVVYRQAIAIAPAAPEKHDEAVEFRGNAIFYF